MSEIKIASKSEIDFLSDQLFKGYLSNRQFSLIHTKAEQVNIAKEVRFIRLEKFVFEKNAKVHLKLRSVYSALHSQSVKVIFKIISDGNCCEILLGIKSPNRVVESSKVLIGSLEGNFPGTTFSNGKPLSNHEVGKINNNIESAEEVTAVLGIPSIKKEDEEEFIQGIENLIFGMQGKPFTALFLADPVPSEEVDFAIDIYEQLYSILSYQKERVENKGFSISIADSIGTSSSLSENISKGTSYSNSLTEGTNESSTTNSSSWFGKKIAVAIGGTGSGLSDFSDEFAKVINLPGEAYDQVFSLYMDTLEKFGLDSNLFKQLKNDLISNKPLVNTKADGSKTQGTSKSETKSESESETLSHGLTEGTTTTNTNTEGKNESIQLTFTNKKVANFLEKIEKQIERLESGKSQGFWNAGAYFLSEEPQNSIIAANIYAGVIKGEKSNIEPHAVIHYNFETKKELSVLKSYLCDYDLPRLTSNSGDDGFLANAINTDELTVQMAMPNKSVPGLDVVEVAPFGSNLKKGDLTEKIEVGNLYNYDKKYHQPVCLDYNKFTSHVFVTGSTGSGKSNVTYNLLENLYRREIKFLVIEPAKGEYKDVFGSRRDVTVLGTNPKLNPLLKINPFSFPSEIHVYEHIDRFIEILNACWPMEAAMPAVLKEGIEQAYICKGWDLINSKNIINDGDFPTFHDLLKVLPDVIDNSGYSQEIKSNYEGALVTRVKSLTNGLLSLVFDKDELSEESLFDQNVIVDLSRVASSETKALLMGLLFMKLNEYRISNRTGNNSDLKHVTVLEEAHNLLKRTSSEQTSSSGNLQGKSVEMISNAIAEMRTYGEGFILADQAPGLMDMSAIRNTNTKICLRLPDYSDRELVGKAMNLTEEQIEELASLDTGVAAIYQNDWQEAILCKFYLFENKDINYNYTITKEERAFKLQLVRYIFDEEFKEANKLKSVLNDYKNEPYFTDYQPLIDTLENEKIAKAFVYETLNIENLLKFTLYNTPKNICESKFRRELKKNLGTALKEYYPVELIIKINKQLLNTLHYGA